MSVQGISEFDDSSDKYEYKYSTTVEWNQKEVAWLIHNGNDQTFANTILETFKWEPSKKSFQIAPMEGSMTVSVEKDSDGKVEASVDLSVTSTDGKTEGSVSGTVDSEGNTSAKAEITFTF